jgi:hypothetical protein
MLKCFRSCDAQLRTSRTLCTATLSVRSTLDPSYFRMWYMIWKTWFSYVRLVKMDCIVRYISTVTGNLKLFCRCILSHTVNWLLYKSHSSILCTVISCPLYLIVLKIDTLLWWTWVGKLMADSHIACRTHAIPLPCCAAKGFECVLHIWFTQCSCVWFTLAMPCSDNAILLKATAQHGRQESACGQPARVRLFPATTWSSTKIVIRSIPILLTTIHTYDCKQW